MEFFSGVIVGLVLAFAAYKIRERRNEKPKAGSGGAGGGGGRRGGGGNQHAE